MNKKEFLKKLKEDEWFDNPNDLINYRLPVVQYFLTNYTNIGLTINDVMFSSKNIIINYNPETDFTLVNQAFLAIKKKFINKNKKE